MICCDRTPNWQTLKRAASFVALFFCAPAVMAQDITLTSDGGGMVLTGRLIGYDGQFVQIATDDGPLTLDYARVTCAGDDCPDRDDWVPKLHLSGAARMADVLMPALVEGFARSRGQTVTTPAPSQGRFTMTLVDPDSTANVAQFAFHVTNTDQGFADLIGYDADMVMAVRPPRPDEVAAAKVAGLGAIEAAGQSRIVGLDAMVPVVAHGTGMTTISLQNLARAYGGAVTRWSQIGGLDVPVSLHLVGESDGQAEGFVDGVVSVANFDLADVVTHADIAALTQAVAATPGALGMAPFGETGNTDPLALRDACGFVAAPVLTAVKTGDYPLTTPLFLYLPARRLPAVADEFMAWLRSPQAQLVVRRAGFVDQGAVPISLDKQGQRFANAISAAGPEVSLVALQHMVRTLKNYTRQSVSFRFEEGSARLDAPSRSNLLGLAQAIRDGRYAGRTLMLAGFSDGRGDAEVNKGLSGERAATVAVDLTTLLDGLPADVTLGIESFGEALPIACDDSSWGRETNRRVELWVSDKTLRAE